MSAQPGDIVNRERSFFNEPSERYVRVRGWIWRAIGEFNRNNELADLYDPRDKRVLLYGCGPAHETRRFVQSGAAHVSGIDISDAEIAQAQRTAREDGYEDRVDFRAGDAHATGFPDDSFDLIVGIAILHHLDVPQALAGSDAFWPRVGGQCSSSRSHTILSCGWVAASRQAPALPTSTHSPSKTGNSAPKSFRLSGTARSSSRAFL